jgi:hypothetical protein
MAVNVRALLRDYDQGIVDWLDGLGLTDVDGNSVGVFYSSWPRWKYQFHPSNSVEIAYNRIKGLPLVAVRRRTFDIDKSRYVFPSEGTKLPVGTITDGTGFQTSIQRVKHPLPVNVEYEINVLDNYITGQNSIIEDIIGAFGVNEIYLNINYFYHKLRFEAIDDESTGYELGDQERLFESTIRLILEAKLVDPVVDSEDVSNVLRVNIDTEIIRGYQGTIDQAYQDWVDADYPFDEPSGEIWHEASN